MVVHVTSGASKANLRVQGKLSPGKRRVTAARSGRSPALQHVRHSAACSRALHRTAPEQRAGGAAHRCCCIQIAAWHSAARGWGAGTARAAHQRGSFQRCWLQGASIPRGVCWLVRRCAARSTPPGVTWSPLLESWRCPARSAAAPATCVVAGCSAGPAAAMPAGCAQGASRAAGHGPHLWGSARRTGMRPAPRTAGSAGSCGHTLGERLAPGCPGPQVPAARCSQPCSQSRAHQQVQRTTARPETSPSLKPNTLQLAEMRYACACERVSWVLRAEGPAAAGLPGPGVAPAARPHRGGEPGGQADQLRDVQGVSPRQPSQAAPAALCACRLPCAPCAPARRRRWQQAGPASFASAACARPA